MVSMNYRLGPFGFLCLGTEDVPGNMALKDQNLALSWVNRNIKQFGGDPNSITIFGQSAGAGSVAYQIISPMSKGLFKRAIMESGSAIGPVWGHNTKEQSLKYGEKLKDALNCSNMGEDELNCLQDKSVEEILGAMSLGYDNSPFVDLMIWQPAPDKDFIPEQPFLPNDPEELLKSGKFNTDVDVIMGCNSDEGLAVYLEAMRNSSLWKVLRDNFEVGGTKSLFGIVDELDITSEDIHNMNTLVEFYVGSLENIDEKHAQRNIDMFTDAFFQFGTYKTIRHMLNQNMNVYQYILSYKYSNGLSRPFGVNHGEDLTYLFDPPFGSRTDCCHLNDEDERVRLVMMEAWTNFAKTGAPGLGWNTSVLNSDNQYWNISGPAPNMEGQQALRDRMDIWDEVCFDNVKC